MKLIIGLCLLLLSSVASANKWDYNISDDPYGDDRIALFTRAINSNGNIASLVVRCTPINNTFELYVTFGEDVTRGTNELYSQVQVDGIDPFVWTYVDSGSDNDSAFIIDDASLHNAEDYTLLQEMAAGRTFKIRARDQLNDGKLIRANFSLIGFTRTWNETCGNFTN